MLRSLLQQSSLQISLAATLNVEQMPKEIPLSLASVVTTSNHLLVRFRLRLTIIKMQPVLYQLKLMQLVLHPEKKKQH